MLTFVPGMNQYLLNREPHSTHIKLSTDEGFIVACDIKTTSESKFTLNQLAPKFKSILQDDLVTSGTFIQAVKKPVNDA